MVGRLETHDLAGLVASSCPMTGSSPPQVNEIDFQDSIMVLGFPEELNKELLSVS